MSPVHNLNFVQQLSLKLRTLFGVGLNVINKNVIFLFCCFKNVYMSVIFVCLMLGLHLHQPFVLSLKPMSDYNVFNVRVSLISAVCLVFKTYVSDFHVFNVRAVLGCPSCCVSQLVFAINEYRCKQEKAFKPKELTSVL